jgi:hypothetical protein
MAESTPSEPASGRIESVEHQLTQVEVVPVVYWQVLHR